MPKKIFQGVVTSAKMQKTVVVTVSTLERHKKYKKVIKIKKKFYAHTELEVVEGDQVVIQETRPLSKLKRWVVLEKKS